MKSTKTRAGVSAEEHGREEWLTELGKVVRTITTCNGRCCLLGIIRIRAR
jgi:hypothetical protein